MTRNGGGIQINEANHSTMTPAAKLNLTEGISGSLTNQIVEYHIKREDARSRANANENERRKRRATAQGGIDQHERMTEGLHFLAVGNTSLCPT